MLADHISRNAFDTRLLKAERNLDNIIELSDDFAYWDGQELSGAVALATNSALALGRNEVANSGFDSADHWTINSIIGTSWSIAASVAHYDDSDDSDLKHDDSPIEINKTYIWSFDISNATSDAQLQLSVTDLGAGKRLILQAAYANGHHDIPFTAIFSGLLILVRADTSGGTFDFDNCEIKQTDIAASSAYPQTNVIVNPSFTADSDWTKGDAAITIASGKATWSGAQAGNADLTATVAPLTSGIRYKQFIVLSGVSAGTITPIFGTQAGTALNANGTYPLAEEIANGTAFVLRGDSSFIGSCELVEIQPANPMNGDYTGVTLGQPGNGQVPVMVEYGGAADYTDVSSAEFNSILDPAEFALSIIVQKDTWDAAERYFFSHTVDSDNWIRCGGTSTIGQLLWEVRAGGTTEQILLASGSPTDIFHMGIQVKSGVMSAIYRGEIIATEAVAGTFVGNFDTMIIGAKNDTPNNVHLGKLAYHVHSKDKSVAQWLREAKAAGAI